MQIRMLDVLIATIMNEFEKDNGNKEVIRVTAMMVQAFGVTANTIHKITEDKDMSIRDCFGMARSAFELALNICYIVSSGPEMARRADRHAMQKSYRDLNRSSEVAGIQYTISRSNIPDPGDIPGLSEAMAEFSDKKGREVSAWTPLNVPDRILAVRKACPKAGMALMGASVSIYRHSSEFLHGTYFSVIYFWRDGGFDGRNMNGIKANWNDTWNEHFVSVYGTLYLSICAMVDVYKDVLKIDRLDGLSEANEEFRKMILEKIEGNVGVDHVDGLSQNPMRP